MNRTFDALVIGAGPAGRFAALALHDAGISVALIAGPHSAPSDHRTTALLGGSVTALERLGVWDDCRPAAAPLRTMRLIDDTGRLLRAPLIECRSDEIGRDAFGYNLPNDALNAALEAAMTQQEIVTIAAEAETIDFAEQQAQVRLSNGETLAARLLVGADGRNSLVRRALSIPVDETAYPQIAVTLNVAHDRPHGDVSTEFHTPTGPFTLVPLPGNRSSVVCVVRPETAEALLAMDDAALGLELERRSHSLLGRLRPEPGRGRFPLARIIPRRFSGPRAVLVGEAAHVVPPIGAQGLNLGLRDGAALADCVAEARARNDDIGGSAVTDAYDRARRTDIAGRGLVIDALNRSLLSDFLPASALRGGGLWLMDKIGPLRRAFMQQGLQPSSGLPRLMQAETPAS